MVLGGDPTAGGQVYTRSSTVKHTEERYGRVEFGSSGKAANGCQ